MCIEINTNESKIRYKLYLINLNLSRIKNYLRTNRAKEHKLFLRIKEILSVSTIFHDNNREENFDVAFRSRYIIGRLCSLCVAYMRHHDCDTFHLHGFSRKFRYKFLFDSVDRKRSIDKQAFSCISYIYSYQYNNRCSA